MIRPDHCTAPKGKECWECYQSWLNRATERRINRALKLVKGRASRVTNEVESIAKLAWSIDKLYSLHNQQWREMVRGPRQFNHNLETKEPTKVKPSLSLTDLIGL